MKGGNVTQAVRRAWWALSSIVLAALLAGTAAAANTDLLARPHIDYGRGVLGLPHLTYDVVNGYRPIQMSLFVPTAGSNAHPIVIYLHGGGFTLDPDGDEGIMGNEAMVELAARGYLVARPAYRLSSEARFPAAIEDVKVAVRWLRTYAKDYGGDARHIVVWGSSAGGDLAALLGTSCGVAAFDRIDKLPQRVGSVGPRSHIRVRRGSLEGGNAVAVNERRQRMSQTVCALKDAPGSIVG
jgi:acetyl esterase/lipase